MCQKKRLRTTGSGRVCGRRWSVRQQWLSGCRGVTGETCVEGGTHPSSGQTGCRQQRRLKRLKVMQRQILHQEQFVRSHSLQFGSFIRSLPDSAHSPTLVPLHPIPPHAARLLLLLLILVRERPADQRLWNFCAVCVSSTTGRHSSSLFGRTVQRQRDVQSQLSSGAGHQTTTILCKSDVPTDFLSHQSVFEQP